MKYFIIVLSTSLFFFGLSAILEYNLTPLQPQFSNDQIIDWDNINGEQLWSFLTLVQSTGLFTIDIKLGTPGQPFQVMIDTGSFLLWVPTLYSSDEFPIPHHFLIDKSSTYHDLEKSFTIQYATGVCSGFFSTDVLTIFAKEIKFEWGLAYSTNANFACDGILGLGRKFSLQNYSNNQNIIYQFIQNKLIDKNIFTIQLDVLNLANSKIIIGDYPEHFNDNNKEHIGFCNLKESEHWACRLSYIVIGDSSVENFKQNAVSADYQTIFDSGSNRIMLPMEAFNIFGKYFSTCQILSNNIIKVVQCEEIPNIPDISFVFNGYSIKLNTKKLFSPYKKQYIFTIAFWIQPLYIIGIPFFYSSQVVFDNENSILKFYVEDKKNIVDVSKYTTDKDFLISENIWVIILSIVAAIVLIGVGVGVFFYLRKKKQGEIVNTLSPLI